MIIWGLSERMLRHRKGMWGRETCVALHFTPAARCMHDNKTVYQLYPNKSVHGDALFWTLWNKSWIGWLDSVIACKASTFTWFLAHKFLCAKKDGIFCATKEISVSIRWIHLILDAYVYLLPHSLYASVLHSPPALFVWLGNAPKATENLKINKKKSHHLLYRPWHLHCL